MRSLRSIARHPTISLVDSCSSLREIQQIQTQLLINGLLNDPLLLGQFVASIALSNPAYLDYSDHVLDQPENPPATLFTLNSMIRAYSRTSNPHKSFHFYNRILNSTNGLSPDNYTFNFLVRTCAQMLARETGSSVHAAVIKYGFRNDPHIQSGLIYMYSEFGCLDSSCLMFEETSEPDLVSQTTMLSASAKLGDVNLARQLFDGMQQRDSIAWNAMISGYAQSGQSREALNFFNLMQVEGVRANEVSMISVLSACTHLGALDQGRWAHTYIEKNKLQITLPLGTALVDMYAKCGDMNKAMEVFWSMKEKNVYSWTSAMNGLAMNGAGKKCLELFHLMKLEGIRPNEVTFVALLRGCIVAGLVEEGSEHFDSMRSIYRLEPQLEHYGCMVDLYGRAGRLDEALNFINLMPLKPHAAAWGALLNACKIYRNQELGELASKKMVELEAKSHGAYVLLSNIYADSKNWDEVSNLRHTMNVKGVKKIPGCSVIEVAGEVHEFFVGDKSHQRYAEIEKLLEECRGDLNYQDTQLTLTL